MRWIFTVAAALMLAGSAAAYVSHADSDAGTIDTLRPTATPALDDPATTALDTVHFKVDFSEPVGTAFGAGNVTLTGSLQGAATFGVSGADPNYVVTVTMNNAEDDGTIGIQVNTAVTDLVGNAYAGGASGTCKIHNWHGFTDQPDPARLYTGGNVTLHVVASFGNSTPVYQWKFDNGSTVQDVGTGATAYPIAGAVPEQNGSYWCAVSYDGAIYESDHVDINIADPILATRHDPDIKRVYTGEDYTLEMTVTGGFLPLKLQWKKDGDDLTGENGASYAITGAGPANIGSYLLFITDDVGTTANSASVQVLVADHLKITADPVGADKAVGTGYTFTVGTSGGFPALSYQWKRNGDDVPDAADNQLSIASIQPENEGDYTVVVSDAGGDVRTSQPALLHVVGPLTIQQNPQSARAYTGELQKFTVETSGGVLPLQYQWRKGGVPLSAPNLYSYTIGSVDSSHAGSYSVVVTDTDGASKTSGDGVLAVADHLRITAPPTGGQEVVGAAHTFTVATSGGYAPLTYVWRKNGAEIPGAEGPSYTTPRLALSDSATFTVEVSDAYDDVKPASANLTVVPGVPVTGLAGLGGLLGLVVLSGARRVRRK